MRTFGLKTSRLGRRKLRNVSLAGLCLVGLGFAVARADRWTDGERQIRYANYLRVLAPGADQLRRWAALSAAVQQHLQAAEQAEDVVFIAHAAHLQIARATLLSGQSLPASTQASLATLEERLAEIDKGLSDNLDKAWSDFRSSLTAEQALHVRWAGGGSSEAVAAQQLAQRQLLAQQSQALLLLDTTRRMRGARFARDGRPMAAQYLVAAGLGTSPQYEQAYRELLDFLYAVRRLSEDDYVYLRGALTQALLDFVGAQQPPRPEDQVPEAELREMFEDPLWASLLGGYPSRESQ